MIATDYDEEYVSILKNTFRSCSSIAVHQWDIQFPAPTSLEKLDTIDTIFCSNVLEHLEDQDQALQNMYEALKPGGNLILIIPQGHKLYSTLDKIAGHYRRYDRQDLEALVKKHSLEIQHMISFNKVGVLGWIVRTKWLKAKTLGKYNMKLYGLLTPIFRLIDPLLPWQGLSWILVVKKMPDPEN